ncbi:TonB-dependent receptor domain-containing protein [Paraferrimonas haliotis]|uniref:Vitamin B12 transporter BtuB n=1 Tax=Paraferrimonas haliotis TaxID=2013866 RepID=A0AA37WW97_9GAMM|nr:TonB-dependent receptor [Paraferrimonas haliotis]GLS82099.1 vitamin B12 transporter BtuB [Paraferrimonas haliotis]
MCFKMRLSLAAVAVTAAFAVQAEQQIDEVIVVTGDRFGGAPEQQFQVINVIERSDIERFNPKSVVDILETLPAVSVIRNGGPAQAATVSIRGANSNNTLVLVDGLRVSSATLGLVNFGALMPEQIERVEVVKGPRAAVWGSDAIGGVIQIFTRKLDGGEGYVTAEGGSNAYGRLSGGYGVSHGDGHTGINLSYDKGDGFDVKADSETDDDGFKRGGIGISGTQQLSQQWQANWLGQYNKGSFEFDSGAPFANETDYANYFWSLGGAYQGERLQSQLTVGQARDNNENYRQESKDNKDLFQTDRNQVSFSNQYVLSSNSRIVAGLDWQNESVKGDFAVDSRDLFGGYGLYSVDVDGFSAEAALRYDKVDKVDSETTYNLSAGYRFNANWRVVATYGTGFKAPSFNDLYYPSLGNPDLKSERSRSYDLSLHGSFGDFSGYVSVYNTDVDDLIEWAPTGEVDDNGWAIWKPANVANATLKGAEASISHQWDALFQQLSYHYLDAKDGDAMPLTGRSRHELDYRIGYQWQAFDAQFDYHYQGKRSGSAFTADMDSYHNLGLSAGYQVTQSLATRVKLTNLLDEKLVSASGFNSPGREFYVTVNYQF